MRAGHRDADEGLGTHEDRMEEVRSASPVSTAGVPCRFGGMRASLPDGPGGGNSVPTTGGSSPKPTESTD